MGDDADGDVLVPAVSGQLCLRGDLEVSNNATVQAPGVVVVGGSTSVANNAALTAAALYVGCDLELANNALIDARVLYGRELTLGPSSALNGAPLWAPCDTCGRATLGGNCDPSGTFDAVEAFARANLDASLVALAPHLPAGSLDDEGNLVLANDAAVSLPGEIFIVSSLELRNNVSLDTSGEQAVLIVLGPVAVANNASLGTSGGRLAVFTFGTGVIALGNNSEAELVLVAPDAELTLLANNVRFTGAVNAGRLVVSNNNELTIWEPGLTAGDISLCY